MACTQRGCYEKTARGFSYCTFHNCRYVPSKKPQCHKKASHNTDCCKNHTCAFSSCKEMRRVGMAGCKSHLCEIDGCKHIRDRDAIGSVLQFCRNHKCSLDNCHNKQKQFTDGIRFKYCVDHNCQGSECTERQPENGSLFCAAHILQAFPVTLCLTKNCSNSARGNSECCIDHTCMFLGCSKEKKENGTGFETYCQDHYNAILRCKTVASDCSLERFRDSNFCKNHTCLNQGCPNEAILYCSEHTCIETDCDQPPRYYIKKGKSIQSGYCQLHECRKEKCHEKTRDPTSGRLGFCNIHACTIVECINEGLRTKGIDGHCVEHHDFIIKQDMQNQLHPTSQRETNGSRFTQMFQRPK